MKIWIMFLVVLALIVGLFYEIRQTQKKVDGFDELIALNNNTQYAIMGEQVRISHYLLGHDHAHPVKACNECGLLQQLTIRQIELDDETVRLSELLIYDPDNQANKERLEEVVLETSLIARHLYSADERAKRITAIINQSRK